MYKNFKNCISKRVDFSDTGKVHKKCTFHRQKKEGSKMITYDTVKEIYNNNFSSERFYKRKDYPNLVYTDRVMDFVEVLNVHLVVDNVISYMQQVIKEFKESKDTFFVVKITLNQEKKGYMEVYREGFIGNDYHEHITVIKQDIPFIDLPLNPDDEITTCKFYLILSNYEPLQFTFMLPPEY